MAKIRAPRQAPARAATASDSPASLKLADRILVAVSEGLTKKAQIVGRLRESPEKVSLAIQVLVREGRLRAEGATVSRRYVLGGRRAQPSAPPAKEGV